MLIFADIINIFCMKFTKEEAFEKLKGILTNNGKKTLRMSERSIEKQLETLMPLIATDDMELDDFIGKVENTFSVMNSNMEKDNSDFIQKWKKDHPLKDNNTPDGVVANTDPDNSDDEMAAKLLKRIEELERKNAEHEREVVLSKKKDELLAVMKEKGIKDEQWAKDFVAEISITEDFDINAKVDSYLKIYNKSKSVPTTTQNPRVPNGGERQREDLLASARELIKQRNKEREEISNGTRM